jgi:hypothetical protein
MDALTLILGILLALALGVLSRELHQTDKLIQRLEQYAANERRPQHGRTIHSNYQEEPTQPVFNSVPQRILKLFRNRH